MQIISTGLGRNKPTKKTPVIINYLQKKKMPCTLAGYAFK